MKDFGADLKLKEIIPVEISIEVGSLPRALFNIFCTQPGDYRAVEICRRSTSHAAPLHFWT